MIHQPLQWVAKPVMMYLAAALTVDAVPGSLINASDEPAVVVTLVAAVVAIVYWLMRMIDKLIIQKTGKEDPALKVLEEIRDCLAPLEADVKDMRHEIDIPHPYNPGFRSFAQQLRKDVCAIDVGTKEVLVALNKNTKTIARLSEDFRVMTPTTCPIKGAAGKELLKRLDSTRSGEE